MANEKLISAAALINAIRDDLHIDGSNFARVKEHIEDAPAVDAVEVVRCKDCKHFTEGMAVGMCKRIADKPIMPIAYDHFCSYGERREGE